MKVFWTLAEILPSFSGGGLPNNISSAFSMSACLAELASAIFSSSCLKTAIESMLYFRAAC